MNAAAKIFAVLAGSLNLLIFAMESLVFRRPTVWMRFLVTSQAEAELVRPWALNQGFYNLFLGVGVIAA